MFMLVCDGLYLTQIQLPYYYGKLVVMLNLINTFVMVK